MPSMKIWAENKGKNWSHWYWSELNGIVHGPYKYYRNAKDAQKLYLHKKWKIKGDETK